MDASDIPPQAAERAALVQRIDRFIRALERVRRPPNRRETYHLVDALQQLAAGRHEDGESAMTRAERLDPLPAHAATTLASNDSMTLEELRQAFETIAAR